MAREPAAPARDRWPTRVAAGVVAGWWRAAAGDWIVLVAGSVANTTQPVDELQAVLLSAAARDLPITAPRRPVTGDHVQSTPLSAGRNRPPIRVVPALPAASEGEMASVERAVVGSDAPPGASPRHDESRPP